MRGRNKPWAKDFIEAHDELIYKADENLSTNELTLEIGIGKGDFIVANAKENENSTHIGVELNTSIFAMAMKKVVNEQLSNVRLLNVKAMDLVSIIKENSISKIYLNFSVPWPQNGYRKRRLVHPLHLEVFEKFLVDGGQIIFKTDNVGLFDMGVKNFNIRNYQIDFISYDYQTVKGDYVTEYEAKFRALNMPIHRIVATVNKDNLKPWNEAMK